MQCICKAFWDYIAYNATLESKILVDRNILLPIRFLTLCKYQAIFK